MKHHKHYFYLFPILFSCSTQHSPTPAPQLTNNNYVNATKIQDSRNVSYIINNNRTSIANLTDSSGQVHITIWQDSISGTKNNLAVEVDSNYVCIGGGAYIDYGNGNGALLTQSSPLSKAAGNNVGTNFTTWAASSTDHIYPNTHKLYVYSIGIKLDSLPTQSLKNQLLWLAITSSSGEIPSASVSAPEGYVLISGGACATYDSGAGSFLTSSYVPIQYQTPSTWFASSTYHYSQDNAIISSYGLFINPVIPNWGTLKINNKYSPGNTVFPGGIASETVFIDQGWVLSGICAQSIYDISQPARMLFSMYPSNNGLSVTAQSKDQYYSSSGSVLAQLFEIKKQ